MPYGTIKVDNIIFTNGGSDQTVTVSGIVASTSGNLTVTGTISGGTVVAPYGSFTSLTGVTTSGTNANFQTITGAVGVYTTSVSGRAVNALTANIVSGVFASGTAAAPSITFTGNTAAGIYSPGTDQVAISTSGTGRLFVNASGNVGVGTSSPTQSLEVNGNVQIGGSTPRILSNMSGAQSTRFSIQNSTTNGNTRFYLYPNGTGNISAVNMYNTSDANATDFQACDLAIIGTSEARLSASNNGAATAIPITFYTANAEKMRLTSAGLLGLGTSSPAVTLDVTGGHSVLRTGLTVQGQSNLATGANLELAYDSTSDRGFIQAFNRTTSAYKPVRVIGSEIQFDISNSEKARIDSSGRLLVGTSSTSAISTAVFASRSDAAAAPLVAFYTTESTVTNGANFGTLSFGNTATTGTNAGAFIQGQRDGGTWTNNTSMPGRLVFSTTLDGAASPTERMRISNKGVVSINISGTSGANTNYLQVYNGTSSQSVAFVSSDSAGNEWHFGRNTSDGNFYVVRQTGTGMYMSTNSWVATSDQRAKQNIADIESTIDVVKALKPSRFNWKSDGTADVGFIAQQVQALIPEAVVDSGNPDAMLGITQDKLLPFVVKALQEAIDKIESLEARLTAAGIE